VNFKDNTGRTRAMLASATRGKVNLDRMRSWGATHGGYTWVISYEPGFAFWTDEQKAKFIGYSASYRLIGQSGSASIKVEGGPFTSLAAAESACRATWRQIRNPN
jgi:hypothetical protein